MVSTVAGEIICFRSSSCGVKGLCFEQAWSRNPRFGWTSSNIIECQPLLLASVDPNTQRIASRPLLFPRPQAITWQYHAASLARNRPPKTRSPTSNLAVDSGQSRTLTTAPLVSQQKPSGNSEETDELHGRSGRCSGRVDSFCIPRGR
jgi:hypothetical protein